MTFIIAHEVIATATRFDGSAGGGWSPRLSVTLGGPVPPAAELVWAVQHSDGWPWFEHRVEVPERAAGELATVELQHGVEGVDGHDTGVIRFSLTLGSAFGGAEELVHDGLLRVERVEGLGYVVDESARLRSATLALDAADEADAPPLRVAAYLPGEFETHRVSVHCFRAGERLAEASRVWNERVFTSHEGRVTGQQVAAVFESVRGWNNLAVSGWGEGWHLLDHHDGDYELCFVLGSQLLRTVTFSVLGGRIVAQGPIEIDCATGHALLLGDTPSASFYGITPAPEALAIIADIYALRLPTDPTAGPPAAEAPSAEALTAYAERVERLLATWESELLGACPPYDLQQVLAAEAVLRERPGYDERAAAVAAANDASAVSITGESHTLGELRERMQALFTAAESRLHTAASDVDDDLAPYRQVLTGDKLALFDDRPIGDFEYRTLERTIISTPEELRDAEYWFFEGPAELTSTAALDGETVKVTTTGWRVVGWRFTPDGTIADRIEHQGPGPDAPLWAYRAPIKHP
ncbi:hypothetical protein SCB71_00725 [Herbiconiux sp. KACC 21604]|uniref:hypothetical protein n=1 Tax=unclassified Herbiconiux TaxID=2618217 RepID=UPI00149173F1|nr:hypothetical protein [Herbiconiux sp. SALV-R1]QJU55597.1 hypothetical protein HL652_19580 [Herbiconiux sp. SALV-R1]WPO86793.1 hypothetical protein SCB71_00725 [Herbiconiux sp. KACC 21604]